MLHALLLLAALPWATCSSAHGNQRRVIQQPGLIRFPITVSEAPAGTFRRLRRQNNADLTSQSTGFFYTIDLVIGTPGQAVPVNFDTGSWELWVNPSCANTSETAICESLPRFTGSTTLVDTNRTGQIAYGAGYAKFKYMYDYISVGGAKINQQIFGVAYDTSVVAYGILGAGPWVLGWQSPYPHVLDSLVSQNHIQSRAFSLDLRPIESPLGAVIFGGIDTKKYIGGLEKRPIATGPDGSVRYWIYVDGLSVTREDGSRIPVFDQTNGLLALLDSGTTLTQLPRSMVTEILKAFPSARQDPNDANQYIVDCAAASLAGTVDFKFGNTVINVRYDDFLWKQPQHGICVLGVSPNDSFFVLGDTFLRSAYAIYDMDNRNVYLAPAADCGTNLVPIGKGTDAVPSLVGECSSRAISVTTSTTASQVQSTTTQDVRVTSSSSFESSTSLAASSTTSASVSSSIRLSSTAVSGTSSTTSSTTLSTATSATTSSTSSATSSATSTTEPSTSSSTPSTTSSATPLSISSATPITASTTASATTSTTASTTSTSTSSAISSATLSTTEPSASSATSSATLSTTEPSTSSSTPSTTLSATPSSISSATSLATPITASTASSSAPSAISSATSSTTEPSTSSATSTTTSSASSSTPSSISSATLITASTTMSATDPTTEPTTLPTTSQTQSNTTDNVNSTSPSSLSSPTSSSPVYSSSLESSPILPQSETAATKDVNTTSSAASSPTSLSTSSFASLLTSTPVSSSYSPSTKSEVEQCSSFSTTGAPNTTTASSSSITVSETQHSSVIYTSSITASPASKSVSEETLVPPSSSLSTSHVTTAIDLSSTAELSPSPATSTTSGSTTVSPHATNKVPVLNQTIPIADTATLPTRISSNEPPFATGSSRGSTYQVATEISSAGDTPAGNTETSAWQSSHLTHAQNNSFTVSHSAATASPDFSISSWPERPSKVTVTTTLTVTSCEPTVSNCPVGKLTTSIMVLDATSHLGSGPGGNPANPTPAGTTAIYTLPPFICGKGAMDCTTPTTLPTQVVTVVPLVTKSVAVTVGDCMDCEAAPTPLAPLSHPSGLNTPAPTQTQLDTKAQDVSVQECSDCSETLAPSAHPETSVTNANDATATHSNGPVVSSGDVCSSCGTPTPSVVTAKGNRRPQSSVGLSAVAVGLALLVALVGF